MPDPDIIAQAQQVRAQAARLPTAEEIEELAERAIAHGGTRSMSLEQVRARASEARASAGRMAELLSHLSHLLEDNSESAEVPSAPGGDRGI